MPFAFNQIPTQETGQVDQMHVSLEDYLGQSAVEGATSSVFGSLYRHQELKLEMDDKSGKTLNPDEANEQWGLPGLKFDQPITVGAAQLLHQRHQAQMDRDFFLSQGNDSLGKSIAGSATSMVAGMLNPLDFSLMFMPIVGEAKLAEGASVLGRGAIRQSIARGLITREGIQSAVPTIPRLTESVVQGMSYQAMAEIPHRIDARDNLQDPGDPLTHILGAGLFSGALHLGLTSAGRMLGMLRPETHEAAFRKAMDDFAKGNDVDVSDVLKQDPAVIHEQAYNELYQDYYTGRQEETGIAKYVAKHFPKTDIGGTDSHAGSSEFAQTMRDVQAGMRPPEPGPRLVGYGGAADRMNAEFSGTMRDIQGPKPYDPLEERGIQIYLQNMIDEQEQKNAQELIEKSRKNADVSGNKTPVRAKENEADIQAGKVLTAEEVKQHQHQQVPETQDVAKVQEHVTEQKKKLERDAKGRFKKKGLVESAQPEPGDLTPEQQEALQKELKEELAEVKPATDVIQDAAGCITKKVL